jgi:hypothetical protein
MSSGVRLFQYSFSIDCHTFVVLSLRMCWLLTLSRFVLFSNKQGQTRFSSYYEWISMDERTALESEIIRKCLSRSELQCSFLEYRGYKVIYRRYASLFFIVGTKPDVNAGEGAENNENELGMLEFIHSVVEVGLWGVMFDEWLAFAFQLLTMLFYRECMTPFGANDLRRSVWTNGLDRSVSSISCINWKKYISLLMKWCRTATLSRRTKSTFFAPLL